jgi:hypothetical protein
MVTSPSVQVFCANNPDGLIQIVRKIAMAEVIEQVLIMVLSYVASVCKKSFRILKSLKQAPEKHFITYTIF